MTFEAEANEMTLCNWDIRDCALADIHQQETYLVSLALFYALLPGLENGLEKT